MTATLAARTRSPEASVRKSGRAHAALRRAIYAPIDDNHTAPSDTDIVAAWLAATIAGLALIATLAF